MEINLPSNCHFLSRPELWNMKSLHRNGGSWRLPHSRALHPISPNAKSETESSPATCWPPWEKYFSSRKKLVIFSFLFQK